jgi:hypothetical protein
MEFAIERERRWAGNFWWSVAGIALVKQFGPALAAHTAEFIGLGLGSPAYE